MESVWYPINKERLSPAYPSNQWVYTSQRISNSPSTYLSSLTLLSFCIYIFDLRRFVDLSVVSLPFTHFDPSWSPAGTRTAFLGIRLLSQFYNRMDASFLTTHHPTSEEQSNPILFAENVRKRSATELGVPTTNHTFEDMMLITQVLVDIFL